MTDENYENEIYKSSEREEGQNDRKLYLKSYLTRNCLLYIGPHCPRQHVYLVLFIYLSCVNMFIPLQKLQGIHRFILQLKCPLNAF